MLQHLLNKQMLAICVILEIDGGNLVGDAGTKGLVGSAISFESPSAAAITAPSGYVAIS